MRPFVEADIPQVADLHRRVFRVHEPVRRGWLEGYGRYFADVFPHGEAAKRGVGSKVFERNGVVLGFLGVVPRPMTFNGQPVVMAVCSQFAVDPAGRGRVGLQLLKECFAGPQDLTISDEAGDNTRAIWEWCGGEAVLTQSLRWIRPLCPAGLALSLLARQKWPGLRCTPSIAGSRLVDAVVSRIGSVFVRRTRPHGSRDALDAATLAACLAGVAPGRALVPHYDAQSAAWAIRRAGQRLGHAPVRRVAVRTATHGVTGWFLYCLSDDGMAEVLQLAARPEAAGNVLDHLFDDAAEQRAVGVCGRLDPQLLGALSDKRVVFFRGDHWTLLHSSRAELRQAVQCGGAFLSRLEGEWCLRYP